MEKQLENTTEENSSMEELKMDEDENIKETTMEDDILGAQSLLMSESDEEVNDDCSLKIDKSPQKKIIKKSKRILDSDDEDIENEQILDQTNKKDRFTANKMKISTIIDSDSDGNMQDYNDEDNKSAKKLSIKTDEDFKINMKALNQNSSFSNSLSPKTYQKSKKCAKSTFETNTGSESADENKKTKRSFSLIDSESSNAESEDEVNASDLEEFAGKANFDKNEENSKKKEKKPKVVRASAKKAMDEMQAIQSEQQRLHREAQISIPYHKPRKHTLDEFLTRRTLILPQKSSPVAPAIQTRSLKMTTEELEEYAKLMEDRAKEASEFFKSESDNEEDVFKDNEGVLNKPEQVVNNLKLPLDSPNEIAMHESSNGHDIIHDLTKNQDDLHVTEKELPEEVQKSQVEKIQEKPACSKVLITEVIELPKLDMNTVQISPLKTHIHRSSLNVKQLLADKILSESPSLSGDPNKLIDLETGDLIDKKPTGVDNLMRRLMSTVKGRKSKNTETCSILSVENGKLEMSEIHINRTEVNNLQKEAKPGAAYLELKRNLKEIIKKKRLEEMNKKQEDELEYSKCLADEDDDDGDKEEDECAEIYAEEYEPDDKLKKEVVVVDDEENALMIEDDGVEISDDEEDAENIDDGDDEREDSSDEDEEAENKYEIGNYNNLEPLDKSQRKNRIIKVFDDTDEEGGNDDIDFLKTQPPTTQPDLLETQPSVRTSMGDENSELIALCSGTFDETQKTSVNALMSQIPITQNSDKQINDEELMELCSGTFDQPTLTLQPLPLEGMSQKLTAKNNVLSSEEEDADKLSNNEVNKLKVKTLTKKLKKKKVKLGFSDDEDEEKDNVDYEDDEQEEADNDNLAIVEGNAEEPETFIDYDSEENEILVKMTKNDKVKQAQNFFENEAELSESEWGSADEDEKNLDKYDIELGDEDEFDREKIQRELGQIHARKMLDEDIRQVRKIQEMFFEDEEKDGVGRQRTFKWKNAENGFSLDDKRPLDENQNDDSGDEINEHQWRKIRYEREQFLKEQGLKPNSQDMSTALVTVAQPFNRTGTTAVTTKKLQIITNKKTVLSTSDCTKGSPFLISKGISGMHKKSVRGSFLVRDKETLDKLAGITKTTSSAISASDMDDTAGTVSIKSIKPKNFVFATLTEEEHENVKRKADDLLNSSNENGKNFIKKPKIEPRRDKCFIDQLFFSHLVTYANK